MSEPVNLVICVAESLWVLFEIVKQCHPNSFCLCVALSGCGSNPRQAFWLSWQRVLAAVTQMTQLKVLKGALTPVVPARSGEDSAWPVFIPEPINHCTQGQNTLVS